VLVLLSLGLITVYFRESSEGPLHAAQRIGVSVLMPFEVAGERVSRPFRDGWAWVSDLMDAKDENERLREENEDLRRDLIAQQTAAQELALEGELADYIAGPRFPDDFDYIVARVVARPPTPYQQEIVIAAGLNDGVKKNAPVVTDEGLVGRVTEVTDSSARILLITDQRSVVSAVVLGSERSDLLDFAVSLQGRIDDLYRAVDEVAAGLSRVDRRVDGSVTNTAVVRYDAYEGTGGQQSASLALLDATRTGTVVTAIQGRDYARIYVKDLDRGRSSVALSPEEQEAVERAMAP